MTSTYQLEPGWLESGSGGPGGSPHPPPMHLGPLPTLAPSSGARSSPKAVRSKKYTELYYEGKRHPDHRHSTIQYIWQSRPLLGTSGVWGGGKGYISGYIFSVHVAIYTYVFPYIFETWKTCNWFFGSKFIDWLKLRWHHSFCSWNRIHSLQKRGICRNCSCSFTWNWMWTNMVWESHSNRAQKSRGTIYDFAAKVSFWGLQGWLCCSRMAISTTRSDQSYVCRARASLGRANIARWQAPYYPRGARFWR